jgi:hypothetical protein
MRRSLVPRLRLAGAGAVLAAAALLAAGASTASATPTDRGTGFVFHAGAVKGAPTGELRMSGIGAFDTTSNTTRAAGSFRCTSSINQGPLAGCLAGQGIRWSAAALLPSAPFKCTSAATEALKTATTDRDTVVLRSEFFRVGDSAPSFTANMFVSTRDLAPDVDGVQNVWVQNVGCDAGITQFIR